MKRSAMAAAGTVVAVGLTLVAAVAPATAKTTGRELIRGTIVASGESGTRTVVSSLIVARGRFKGVGRDVEVANRAGDPQNVSRDDLVFPHGKIHILGTSKAPKISVNPQTCAIKVRIKQTTKVQGGTGEFRHASGKFAGTLRAWGVGARNPDGTCSQQADLLLEADAFSMSGTLSF